MPSSEPIDSKSKQRHDLAVQQQQAGNRAGHAGALGQRNQVLPRYAEDAFDAVDAEGHHAVVELEKQVVLGFLDVVLPAAVEVLFQVHQRHDRLADADHAADRLGIARQARDGARPADLADLRHVHAEPLVSDVEDQDFDLVRARFQQHAGIDGRERFGGEGRGRHGRDTPGGGQRRG